MTTPVDPIPRGIDGLLKWRIKRKGNMAVGYLPEIGSESGPCKDDCEHTDCAETKRMLLTECRWCDLAIGYRGFYNDTPDGEPAWSRLVHAACHEDTPDPRIPDSTV